MAHIKIKKGLDIPIDGKPSGDIKPLVPSGESHSGSKSKTVSLNLKPFEGTAFRLHAKEGDFVKIGQPVAEDKESEGRMFVAPAAGVIREVRRGLKRRLLDIVIEVADNEEYLETEPLSPTGASPEALIAKLMQGGLFQRIRQRPFDTLANPKKRPRTIFVKALESAPYVPPSEYQVMGHEAEFQLGLDALAVIAEEGVHLVYRSGTDFQPFTNARNVETHTAEGPHPVSNHSLHIQKIDPITKIDDVVWTLNAHDVVCIGHFLATGRYLTDRVIAIAGPALLSDQRGFFRVREGISVNNLVAGRLTKNMPARLVSGNPLMGTKVETEEYLGIRDYVFCAIPESTKRQPFHFFRLGADKYSFSRAYLSGHFNSKKRTWDFTTSQHGEERPFIDASLYKEVQPLDISTMLLCKAVMAEDYDLAQELGLLEVSGEDFALPTFVDPSKKEMVDIINEGLRAYHAEVLG